MDWTQKNNALHILIKARTGKSAAEWCNQEYLINLLQNQQSVPCLDQNEWTQAARRMERDLDLPPQI